MAETTPDQPVQVLGRLAAGLRRHDPDGNGALVIAIDALTGTLASQAAAWLVARDGTSAVRVGHAEAEPSSLPGQRPPPTTVGAVADVLAAKQSIEVGYPTGVETPFAADTLPARPVAPTQRSIARFTPVRHRDRIIAVIGVLRHAPGPPFSAADRQLLDAVVERIEAVYDAREVRDELSTTLGSGIQRGNGVLIREDLIERLAHVGGDVLFSHRFGVGTDYVSPGVERLLGFTAEEFLQDPTLGRRIVHPDDRHLLAALSDLPDGFTRPLTVRAVTREGEILHFLVRMSPIIAGGRLIGAEGLATDISALKRHEAELAHQARSDALTGLANRLTFREFQARSLARIERHGGTIGVLYLDLSGFKRVNDTIGHAAGDQVLVIVADRLRKVTRREDVVARLGGDEFTVLMPDIRDETEATTTAQRIIAAIEEPVPVGTSRVSISTGVGIAITSDGTITPDELLHQADQALYAAKRHGAGRWAIHQGAAGSKTGRDDEPDTTPAPAITASALRAALAAGDFRVHYSPVVDLSSGDAVGVEALVRWQHPELGLLPANRFIEQAEEGGVIHGIGDWVLRQGCRQVRTWREQHGWDVALHLNASAAQLANPDQAESVLVTLAAEGMAPRDLHLDVPEKAIATLSPEVERTITTLHRAGVGVTLDEFGTTVSMRTLRRIPFSHIKLDRGLIEELDRKRGDGDDDIVTLAVRLGASLGATVGAVGVERPGQLAKLAALQLASIQGLILGGSGPADSITWRIHNGAASYVAELGEAGWVASLANTPLFTTSYPPSVVGDTAGDQGPPTG